MFLWCVFPSLETLGYISILCNIGEVSFEMIPNEHVDTPPRLSSITGEGPMEAAAKELQLVAQVEENLVVESTRPIHFLRYYLGPTITPHVGDTSFHGPVEGHVDSPFVQLSMV